MNTKVVIGAQWGDEGKGKVTDYLAEDSDFIVRYQGGNNAGHTIEVFGQQYKLQLIPSGIIYGGRMNVIGNGVAFNPIAFFKEKQYLTDAGIAVSPDVLSISDRVNLIMPYHLELDRLKEIARGQNDIGTTGKGIGPCYTDKYERCGIRMCDLMDGDVFSGKLKRTLEEKNLYITKVLNGEALDFEAINESYLALAEELRPYVKDTSVLVYNAIKEGKKVLFEGAQGMLLDIDYGTYPFVTSSNTTSGGAPAGTGIGPNLINEVYGVTKAYTTRVGKGPFPTELLDEMGEHIRTVGHEFGTVTGRARRTGWLDLVIVKTAVRVSGITNLVVTKLDTLAGIETLKVCTGYEFNGQVIDYFPASLKELSACQPVYEEFKGWDETLAKVRAVKDLPQTVLDYLACIERVTGISIRTISVGPGRDETIDLI